MARPKRRHIRTSKRGRKFMAGRGTEKLRITYALVTTRKGDEAYPIRTFSSEDTARRYAKTEFGSMRNLRIIKGFKK